MQVVYGHHNAPAWRGAAIAIGNFDGVHLGHRALIARARELAAARDALTVALTFDPHPSALLQPARAPLLLTSIERRIELLGEAGVDAVVVEPFTHELAGIAPNAFVDDVVIAVVPAVTVDGEIAASTRIRNHLRAGELASAERMLGRQWDVDGEVVH